MGFMRDIGLLNVATGHIWIMKSRGPLNKRVTIDPSY